jgi:hypothetical protein
MNRLLKLGLLVSVGVTITGCGTTMRLSGSPQTVVSGHFRSGAHESAVGGVFLPWKVIVGGDLNRFEECNFQKSDRQGDLVLEIRRHGSQIARVAAPPGVLGVRAHADGSRVVTETIP